MISNIQALAIIAVSIGIPGLMAFIAWKILRSLSMAETPRRPNRSTTTYDSPASDFKLLIETKSDEKLAGEHLTSTDSESSAAASIEDIETSIEEEHAAKRPKIISEQSSTEDVSQAKLESSSTYQFYHVDGN